MSYGVFNFNFLALLISEILGGFQIYTRGPYARLTPLAEKFLCPKRVLQTSNCVFNFNILTLVLSEILGGPKLTLGGHVPPSTPLAEIFLYLRRVRYYV